MYELFTDRARKALQLAIQEAERLDSEHIGIEHLLLGLLKEGLNITTIKLRHLKFDLDKICHEVEKLSQTGTKEAEKPSQTGTKEAKKFSQTGRSDFFSGNIPDPNLRFLGLSTKTPTFQRILENSMEEAKNLNFNYVSTENILLALLREKEDLVVQYLISIGLTYEKFLEEITSLLRPIDPSKHLPYLYISE